MEEPGWLGLSGTEEILTVIGWGCPKWEEG